MKLTSQTELPDHAVTMQEGDYLCLGKLLDCFWQAGNERLLLQQCCEILVGAGNYRAARLELRQSGQLHCAGEAGSGLTEQAASAPQFSQHNWQLETEWQLSLSLLSGTQPVACLPAAWQRELCCAVSKLLALRACSTCTTLERIDQSDALRDITQALLLREQALVSSSNGIMITRSDADDHSIVYVNPAFERITGYSAREVIGLEGRFLVRDDLQQPDLEQIRAALRERREGRALLRNYRKDGSQFWNELHISPVKDQHGIATTHFVSVINDVSERVNYQKELEYQATHDHLTGLANRHLLNDRITQAIAWARRQNLHVGIMLLDLDHFKLINDASGHGTGDAMLKQIARRISRCVRDTDTVARLGGDEFVVVLSDLQHPEDIDRIAEKIMGALAQPVKLNGQEIFVSASIGVSCYPRDGDHGEILLRYADIAMYRVKEHGRNSVRQFAPEMGQSAISRLNMEHAMRRGIENNEFLLYFQPKIDLNNGQVTGAEALLRWNHSQLGLVQPAEFISLAEETGLIIPLGEFVLKQACHYQKQWMLQGYGELQIAVNVSSRQFRQENLAQRCAEIMTAQDVDPRHITLELTESMVMQDVSSALLTLNALKQLGVTISLDDFGTGYSSLSYLRRFPIDELKIDKSFINDIHSNPDDTAIASAIIAMALSLGLAVVAEGVEKVEQADSLRSMGCNLGQGYYFAKPMDAPSFEKFMQNQRKIAT